MEEPLRDQIRYLELRLARCLERPALHTAQIAGYRHQLELARQATSGRAYLVDMARTDTALELVRAEWIDRYRNWGHIYRALGEREHLRAADINRRAAEQAGMGPGLMPALMGAKARSAPMGHIADASPGLLQGLLLALLEWRVAVTPNTRAEYARATTSLWNTLRTHDPSCTWRRILSYPPYRHRLPFATEPLQRIGVWLREIVGERACDQPLPEVDAHRAGYLPAMAPGSLTANQGEVDLDLALPTAREVAMAYHMTHDAIDRDDPDQQDVIAVYLRIFQLEEQAPSGPAFLRVMAEEGLYCRLARAQQLAMTRRGLARCLGQSQPHAEYHYRELEAALLSCSTPTDVEYEVERGARMFAVEVAWNDILLGYASRVVTAVSAYIGEPDPLHQQSVETCQRAIHELLGRDGLELLRAPRLWDMFCKVWFQRGRFLSKSRKGDLGTRFGELGVATVARIREVSVQRLIERSQEARATAPEAGAKKRDAGNQGPHFDTPEELRAYLERGLWRALGDRDSPSSAEHESHKLVLWGRSVELDQLHEELAQPGRPAIIMD